MPDSDYLRCPHLFTSTGPRCELAGGHFGPHNARVIWGESYAASDAATIRMPPIRDTARRRPPPATVRELTDRAELLEAMGRELQRELRELTQAPAGDDDQADDE